MNEASFSGSCLCGAVTYTARAPFKTFQYCHCSRCRKFTGSAYASNLFCPPAQFEWTQGEENVGRYEPKDAKYYATSFCRSCGSSLPWANQAGTIVVIPAGTLDDDPVERPVRSIFWGSRAAWYVEPQCLEQFEELPPRKPR